MPKYIAIKPMQTCLFAHVNRTATGHRIDTREEKKSQFNYPDVNVCILSIRV